MHVTHVTAALTRAIEERGAAPKKNHPLENGSEFTDRALEIRAIHHNVQLCFIRPGRPIENGFIENLKSRPPNGHKPRHAGRHFQHILTEIRARSV